MELLRFTDIVDIKQIEALLQNHHRVSRMAYGLFDTDEVNIIAVGWQDICVKYHRIHPVTEARCRESDAFIKKHLFDSEGSGLEYRCKNGMIDVAMPVFVDGAHMATLFTGQFFYDDERLDLEFYRTQAAECGFDVDTYLEMLGAVPVFSREYVRNNMVFLRSLVEMLARMGLINRSLKEKTLELEVARKELELTSHVFENSRLGIAITDQMGNIIKVNPHFSNLTGYTQHEVVGSTPRIIKSNRQGDEFYSSLWSSLVKKGHWSGEIWNRKKNGVGYAAYLSISSVKDDVGCVKYFIGMSQDITEQKITADRIRHLAHYDLLTELPNRFTFNTCFNRSIELSKEGSGRVALMYLDIDDFKRINDTQGHHQGDVLLQAVSSRISGVLRKTDCLARLGGDEFGLIFEDVQDLSDVERVARKIIEVVSSTPVELEKIHVHVGISIGISVFPDDGDSLTVLMKDADTAMYQAKAAGKNRFQFFDSEMAREASERITLESDLRKAIEAGDQLFLMFQPQVDLRRSKVVGFEALVRWNHPNRGQVSPLAFIGVAEDTGLILPLGDWVLESACRQLAQWTKEWGFEGRMAINISVCQFESPHFIEMVRSVMKKYRISGHQLELELTESNIMRNVEQSVELFRILREMGVNVAVDDFGTGYSSLAYLRKLPINRLKIDRSFIREIPDNQEDVVIANTIVGMARCLNLSVVAEGVETECQRRFLVDAGCDEGQGFLFAKPMTAEDVRLCLESSAEAEFCSEAFAV